MVKTECMELQNFRSLFKYLGEISGAKSEMVLPGRFELPASPLPRECSTPELRQRLAGFLSESLASASAIWTIRCMLL